jgi:hypothetical protein
LGIRFGSSTTAAATTGPASGPRPASSQPATGQTPRLISPRSRRKLGGATAMTPFGRPGLVPCRLFVDLLGGLVPNHGRIVRKRAAPRNRKPRHNSRYSAHIAATPRPQSGR